MTLTGAQIELLQRRSSGWLGAWFITDFDAARKHAVQSQGGGTYYLDPERTDTAWYETTSKGWAVRRRHDAAPIITVTWAQVREWADSIGQTDRARITELALQLRQREHAGLKWRMYTFRTQRDDETPEEWQANRDARYAEIDADNTQWSAARRVVEDELQAVLTSTMPTIDEDLFAAMGVEA